jgi:hypothetical protein
MDNLPDDFYSGRFMVNCPLCGNTDHVTEGCACSESIDDCVCGERAWSIDGRFRSYTCDKCGGLPGSGKRGHDNYDKDACDEWADWNEEA